MNKEVADILHEALRLPMAVRAELAGELIRTLDETVDPDAEEAWQREFATRAAELDRGVVQPVSWIEARRRLRGG
ncbi:MAG: addiction module protein [Phycisphaerales bacterium]